MASLQTVVELIFSATNNASGAINDVAGGLGKIDASVQNIAAPFADFANGLLKAEAAALALGATLGVLAVKETIKFQDSLYLVQKQLGDSGAAIEEARQDIEGLALEYGINANEVANSMAGFLAAGHDYTQSAELVKIATQLMIAGELDAKVSTDALNQSLAGFRVPANEAASSAQKVGDILNKIGDISSGKFEEIVQGFSRISPTAKDAGLSMEETAAIIASLVDIFGSGEIAATALKSGLLSLLDPSKEGAAAIASLGVATTGSNGELRSSKDILADLAGRWNTLTDAQKQQTAAVIFGKDQAGAMSAVLGDWAKVQSYVTQLVDKTTGAVGSMAREVEGKLASISLSVNRANESWRQFLENLGARLTSDPEKNLQGVIDAAGKLGIAFKNVVNQGGFDPLLELVQGQAGELEKLLETIAKNLPEAFKNLDFSGLIDSLKELGGEVGELFKAFFGEIDLTTVEGLTSALQTTINTFSSLTTVVTGIISAFQPMAAAVGGSVQQFNELDQASALDFGKFLGSMKLLVDAGTGLGGILIAIGQAGVEMGSALDMVFGGAKIAVNALQLGFDTLALGIIKVGQVALEAALALYKLNPFGDDSAIADAEMKIQALQGTADIIVERMTRNADELRQGWNQATGETAAQAQAMREKLDAAKQALDAAGNAAKGAGDQVADLGQRLPVSEFDGAIGALRRFEDAAGSIKLGESIVKEMEDAKKKAQQFEKDLQDAITGGNEGGYTVKFNSEGLPEISADVNTLKGAFKEVDGTVKTTADGFKYVQDAVKPATTGMVLLADGTIQAGVAVEKAGASFSQLGPSLFKSGEDAQKLAAGMDATTAAAAKTFEELFKVQGELNDFTVKMEEIASNERIKKMEFAFEVKIADIEAQTKKIEAAFSSLDNTITSTGDTIGSIFGALGDVKGFYGLEKLELIKDQLEIENKLRGEAADQQKRLIEEQIKSLELKNEQMQRGDAMITVQGDGLKPHLEAIMWEILEAVQIRATAEGEQFLLGMG